MTEKQIERIKLKIDKYKKALAKDKKIWGTHHDGQGIRYAIPTEYIKLKDYNSGLKYLKWFDKNFPEDSGFPIFLFESAFILFKCNKLKEAEDKVHRTFFSNTYLFEKFLEQKILQFERKESTNWEFESLVKNFPYNKAESEFLEFADWVEVVLKSQIFLNKLEEFIQIEQKLATEPVGTIRTELVKRLSEIIYGYTLN